MAAVLVRRLAAAASGVRRASTEIVRNSNSVVGGKAPKVMDSTVKLTAIDEVDGRRHSIRGLLGQTLLKTLVRNELVEAKAHLLEDIATCGAECEISMAGEWLEKLPERSVDEMLVLRKNTAKGQNVDVHIRPACQIVLDRGLDGMAFAVPVARPWRTN